MAASGAKNRRRRKQRCEDSVGQPLVDDVQLGAGAAKRRLLKSTVAGVAPETAQMEFHGANRRGGRGRGVCKGSRGQADSDSPATLGRGRGGGSRGRGKGRGRGRGRGRRGSPGTASGDSFGSEVEDEDSEDDFNDGTTETEEEEDDGRDIKFVSTDDDDNDDNDKGFRAHMDGRQRRGGGEAGAGASSPVAAGGRWSLRGGRGRRVQELDLPPPGGVSVIFPGRTGGGMGFRPMTPPRPAQGSGGSGEEGKDVLPIKGNLTGFKASTVPPLFKPSGPSAVGVAAAAARRMSQVEGGGVGSTAGARRMSLAGSDIFLLDDDFPLDLAELESLEADVLNGPWF